MVKYIEFYWIVELEGRNNGWQQKEMWDHHHKSGFYKSGAALSNAWKEFLSGQVNIRDLTGSHFFKYLI